MRTTLNLDENLFQKAVKATGVNEKTKLVHLGFEALVKDAASKRLAALYGSFKKARGVPRRKFS